MLANQICHKFFKQSLTNFNEARTKSLLTCSDALIKGDRLTLTDLGRNLSGKAQVKHKIKRVDRLLKNPKLHNELGSIYGAIAKKIYSSLPYLVIAVDWSGCCRSDYHLLRASLVVDGRSLPVYNLIVETKDYAKNQTHINFLTELKRILNTDKKVYIVTDGGYLTPWFTEVLNQGWHFVGRLRGTMKCKVDEGEWSTLKELHSDATNKPQLLGNAIVGRSSKTSCTADLHLYKGKKKGRKGKSTFTKDTKMYQNMANEPWLIASSDTTITSAQVINLYSKRMQIEQNFRDDKSPRYGFSWRFSKSIGVNRMSVLCLIACIATLTLWFIGFEGEKRQLHYQFQANTIKNRRVLSFISLSKNILKHLKRKITINYFKKSLLNFKNSYDSLMLKVNE
jgi:hypothetical protein